MTVAGRICPNSEFDLIWMHFGKPEDQKQNFFVRKLILRASASGWAGRDAQHHIFLFHSNLLNPTST